MTLENTPRFDMAKPPVRQWHILRPITWLLSFPAVWRHRTKIVKINMQGLKGPYLLLSNHNAFMDFKVLTRAIFPRRANYVVAIDGFIKREWLLRKVGCICKRKFTGDVQLVHQLRRVLNNGDIAVIYPEARYSLCGTNALLPDSLGKLVKLFKVPLAVLIINGHHINSPFWNTKNRGVKNIEATLTQLLSADEASRYTADEINEKIRQAFVYDDFAWQKERGIRVTYKDRAKGLHKVLYQCPNCEREYHMNSAKAKLWCENCGKKWEMTELGELEAMSGETEFSHIPDWYEWQRLQVRHEVEADSYYFKCPVTVDSLPNTKGFIPLGEGELVHDMKGFNLQGDHAGEKYNLEISPLAAYSCHIEYNYLGKHGDCVDLNTLKDTFYIYPKGCAFSVTKISLATEELYKYTSEKKLISGKIERMSPKRQ